MTQKELLASYKKLYEAKGAGKPCTFDMDSGLYHNPNNGKSLTFKLKDFDKMVNEKKVMIVKVDEKKSIISFNWSFKD